MKHLLLSLLTIICIYQNNLIASPPKEHTPATDKKKKEDNFITVQDRKNNYENVTFDLNSEESKETFDNLGGENRFEIVPQEDINRLIDAGWIS